MIPGDLDTETRPPMRIPLAHFVVALGLLLAALLAGLDRGTGLFDPSAGLAHVHLLLVGWVCLTIAGATTQFVPVWSGVALHSRRLAWTQLGLVTLGLVGFAFAVVTGRLGSLPLFAALMLLGFWTFVYNLGQTLVAARPLDVTERHFAYALGCFVAVTTLGATLAIGFLRPGVLGALDRTAVRGAHVALALFGAVLLTVFGALYQLVPMFAQSPLDSLDERLQTLEEGSYPLGVLLLAVGRLTANAMVTRVGGVLVVVGLLAVAVVVARRLRVASVEWGAMLRRYAVLPATMGAWALWTLPYWLARPLDPAVAFGAPRAFSLLVVGIVGFVVAGSLYHVVPFIVWMDRYSDRLGLEPVPMIDDLYLDRVARVDFIALVGGTTLVVASDALSLPGGVGTAGEAVLVVGFGLFVLNLWLVVWRHAVYPVVSGRFGHTDETR